MCGRFWMMLGCPHFSKKPQQQTEHFNPIWLRHLPVLVDRVAALLKHLSRRIWGWSCGQSVWISDTTQLGSMLIWLVVEPPLSKIWKSMGRMTSHIWHGKYKSCSKPPTSYACRLSMDKSSSWFQFSCWDVQSWLISWRRQVCCVHYVQCLQPSAYS